MWHCATLHTDAQVYLMTAMKFMALYLLAERRWRLRCFLLDRFLPLAFLRLS